MPSERDAQFAQVAVAKGYAAPEQVNECLEVLAGFQESGAPRTLKRIMIEKGFLTQAQADQAAEEAYGDALVGEIIGNCEIREKLGQGGMGIVYKAEHCSLHRTSAFKILDPLVARRREQVRKRFIREAQLAAQLNHPNVVTVHNADVEGDYYFIEMEYIEGRDLAALVGAQGPLPVQKAVDVMRQAAKGLAAGHDHPQRIIHRDVKPQNMLVAPDGRVKVADFGLAKAAESQPSDISAPGAVMGTAHYMSPEQFLGEDIDHRTDIYSLGVAFYYVITGRLPYEGDSFARLRRQHIEGKLTPPKHYNPNLPDEVDEVIVKMMAKSPDDRYATMGAVVAALESISQRIADLQATMLDERDEPRIGLTKTFAQARLKLPSVRKPAYFAVAGVLVVLAFVAAFAYLDDLGPRRSAVEKVAKGGTPFPEEGSKIVLGEFSIPDDVQIADTIRGGQALREAVAREMRKKGVNVAFAEDGVSPDTILATVTVAFNEGDVDKPIVLTISPRGTVATDYPIALSRCIERIALYVTVVAQDQYDLFEQEQ